MSKVVRVSFQQVYDLVFRAKNAKLETAAYVLDFYDWVKAGVAFNTRGFNNSSRKIAYFAGLYHILEKYQEQGVSVLEANRMALEEALFFYYEDILEVYSDHLESKRVETSQRGGRSAPQYGNLLVLPCFDEVPGLKDIFSTRKVRWDNYECASRDAFLCRYSTPYLTEGSGLFRCMSLMYDYGVSRVERGVLLEVELWEEAT